MFAASGEIAADAAEHPGTVVRPEASGDFLVNFGHADIVFPLIVGKGDTGVGQETQGLVLEVA